MSAVNDLDAVVHRDGDQRGQQQGADAAALVPVDHGDRGVGRRRFLRLRT
jgi:hypothetical protein